MYSLISSDMQPRIAIFGTNVVSKTRRADYLDWEDELDDMSETPWRSICSLYGEQAQFDMLRGLTVVGAATEEWSRIFGAISVRLYPYDVVAEAYLRGTVKDWLFFARCFALDPELEIHYPALCPEWLFPYGYTQQQYIQDLSRCWTDVDRWYFDPWHNTRLGHDSPEIARIKKIGQVARHEIDDVARHGNRHLKN